jgi:hypothetical protein
MFLVMFGSYSSHMLPPMPSSPYHLAFGPVLKICFALGTLREPFYSHKKVSTHIFRLELLRPSNLQEQEHSPGTPTVPHE